jgi:hypothetical protein
LRSVGEVVTGEECPTREFPPSYIKVERYFTLVSLTIKSLMKTNIRSIGNLDINYDAESGQILDIFDRALEMQVISFRSDAEMEINGNPIQLRLASQDEASSDPAWQCSLKADKYLSTGVGWAFDIFRQVVVGSQCKPSGNQLNPPNSLHIRYRLDRRQMTEYTTAIPQSAGKRPMQAPLWLDTIGTLCARTDWFGPETKMLAAHFGGGGPREHVSFEDDLVSEVVPHLCNMFRRSHPGVQTIPGAVYYHEDGRWLWITCQRPSVGMHWDWETDAQKAQFEYHARLTPSEVVHTPEVSLYWGTGGKPEMFAVLNKAFIGYEEPKQEWWYNTCWHWMLWWGYRPNGFDDMADQAQYLYDELGLTGFGLTTHDLRPGAWDCTTSGLRPSPHWGGDAGIRRFTERVKSFGGHTYVWLPSMGLSYPGWDMKDHWRIKGDDGRPFESFYIGSCDLYNQLNYDHPEVQAYYLDWIQRYIGDYGVDGIFWDCGGAPMPSDFSPTETRPFQRFPSETMTSYYRFMEKVMQVGRSRSKDFFMWHECFSTDLPGMGYSMHTGADPIMFDINRYGKNRLVFRSSSVYNLYGGFPYAYPREDGDFPASKEITLESYRPMVEDKMNQWFVKFVREHGCRDAIGLATGVSLCAGHVVVDPKRGGEITIPKWAAEAKGLRNVFSGESIAPIAQSDEGMTFSVNGKTAYEVI